MATVDIYKIKVNVSGDKNVRGLQKDLNSLEGGLNKAGKSVLALGAVAAGAFVAIGVSAFKMADAVVDSANGLGIAVDRFYQIGLAAEQSGIAFDDAAKFMGKFAKSIDASAKGSQDMQDNFAKAGVSLDDLANLSDEDLFNKVVAGLADMGEGTDQTAVSMALLGKAARDLDFGTFQEELQKNGVESEEAARLLLVGAEAADSLERAFRQLQIIALRVFEPVIQGLADFDLQAEETQKTIKLLGAGMAAIGSAILVANIIKLVGAFKQLSIAARAVAVAQTAVIALTGPAGWAVIAGGVVAAAGAYVALDKALDGSADSAEDLADSITDVAEAETEVTEARVIQGGTDAIALQLAKDRIATSQQNLTLAKEQLQESIKFIGVEKDIANLQKANTAAENTAKKEIQVIEALINQELVKATSTSAEQVELYRAQQDAIRANVDVIKELNREQYEQLYLLKSQSIVFNEIVGWLDTYFEKSVRIETQLDRENLLQGKITQETYNQIVAAAELEVERKNGIEILENELQLAEEKAVVDQAEVLRINLAMIALIDKYAEEKRLMEEREADRKRLNASGVAGAVEAISQIQASLEPFQMAQDAITQTWGKIGSAIDDMVDNGKSSFSDLADSILKDLAKMIIKAYIFKALTGLGGALGFDMSFLGKATGGPVSGKTPYIVGERGPELFVPQGAGNIIPNHRLPSGGGSSTQAMQAAPTTNNYITNNINALDSRSVAEVFAENRQSLLGTVEYARKETAYGV